MPGPIEHANHIPTPSAGDIQCCSKTKWNRQACQFQAEITEYLLWWPRKNLVSTAATGSGKTYSFFLPALYEKEESVTFIIVPLKKLGDQHQESATSLGLRAIALEAKTINKDVIKVWQWYTFKKIMHIFL